MSELTTIIVVLMIVICLGGILALAYVLTAGTRGKVGEVRGLMGASSSGSQAAGERRDKFGNKVQLDPHEVKEFTSKSIKKKSNQEDLGQRLFRAGFYRAQDKRNYQTAQLGLPVGLALLLFGGAFAISSLKVSVLFGITGVLAGYLAPTMWLDRRIRKREDEIMYFLPLVIEQISIGVSSSLDVGPCISNIITMSDERDSHNAVTEMLIHVEKLIRSGLNLEDALTEVGTAYGMPEVKHAFMFLGQCAKHGGELTKQLQELADAVSTQRQVRIEGKITALPVKATGPLTTVFVGFFLLILSGLLVRLFNAFGG